MTTASRAALPLRNVGITTTLMNGWLDGRRDDEANGTAAVRRYGLGGGGGYLIHTCRDRTSPFVG